MKINIQSLKQGITEAEEVIDSDFLPEDIQSFYPERLNVHVLIDKFDRDFRVKLRFTTLAHYQCDRCLEPFEQEVAGQYEQIFTLGGEVNADDVEIIHLSQDAKEVDLSPFITESVLLIHPIKMLCNSDCLGICPRCGTDLNKGTCNCSGEKTDPRWDALRKFIK